jgi:hypothetical protein
MPAVPETFFTSQSFLSLAGSSAAVFVVGNALQSALNFNPRWLALTLSEIVGVYGAYASHNIQVPSDYFIAALNGCLIYCTAVGGTSIASSAREAGRPKGFAPPRTRRQFTSLWF